MTTQSLEEYIKNFCKLNFSVRSISDKLAAYFKEINLNAMNLFNREKMFYIDQKNCKDNNFDNSYRTTIELLKICLFYVLLIRNTKDGYKRYREPLFNFYNLWFKFINKFQETCSRFLFLPVEFTTPIESVLTYYSENNFYLESIKCKLSEAFIYIKEKYN